MCSFYFCSKIVKSLKNNSYDKNVQLSVYVKQTQYDKHLGFILRKIRDQGKIFKVKPGKILQKLKLYILAHVLIFSDKCGRNLIWMKRDDTRAIKIMNEDHIWSLFGNDVKKDVLKHGEKYSFLPVVVVTKNFCTFQTSTEIWARAN